jgi:hypothetical protein
MNPFKEVQLKHKHVVDDGCVKPASELMGSRPSQQLSIDVECIQQIGKNALLYSLWDRHIEIGHFHGTPYNQLRTNGRRIMHTYS